LSTTPKAFFSLSAISAITLNRPRLAGKTLIVGSDCAWIFTAKSCKKCHPSLDDITVVGKAFWDVGHAPKDQGNRRKYMPDYAVWEIYPVMALHVDQ
jgi:hypothetical protein